MKRPWFLALFAVGVVLTATFWPLLSRQAEPVFDARDVAYPAFTYQADALGEGRLPLWDPYTNCGYPFHADPNNPVLSPIANVMGWASGGSAYGFVLYMSLFWLIAALGALVWAKRNAATPLGATVCAITYAFSGFMIGHGQHTGFIVVAAFMPWIFFLAERAVVRASRADALLCGSVFGLCALGGYPAMVFFCALVLGAWLLLRVRAGELDGAAAGWSRKRVFLVVQTLAIAGVVLCVVYAPVLFAFVTEGGSYTDRVAALPPDVANNTNVFAPPAFFSLFYPYSTFVARPFLETDLSMANGYVGVLALPLASLWVVRGGKLRWWFIGLCIFILVLSMGGQAGLRTLVYYTVPPMRLMRHSAVFRLGWMLPVALAAGLGVSALQESAKVRPGVWRVFVVWVAAALLAALVLRQFLDGHGVQAPAQALYGAPLAIVAAAAVLAFALRKSTYLPLAIGLLVIVDLCLHVRGNSATVWTVASSVPRADAAHVRSSSIAGEPGARLKPLAYGYFNAHQVLKQSVVLGYTAMKSEAFEDQLVRSRFLGLLMLPARAWLSPGSELASSHASAMSTLRATSAEDPAPAFVEVQTSEEAFTRVRAGSFGTVKTTASSPERVDMQIDVPGNAPALLVTTERYGAAWTALVDGVQRDVVKTNLFFRGVWVPPGQHSVVWVYQPTTFLWLALLSLLVLVGSAVCGGYLLARERRS